MNNNTKEEIWKDVVGYEGLYMISSLGRVWGCKHKKIKKPLLSKGYYLMSLNKNNIQKYCSVHRLVAKAFIPNEEGKPEVNHKDENKLNNNIDNLEWVTSKENANWGTRNERALLKKSIGRKVIQKVEPLTEEVIGEYIAPKYALRSVGVMFNNGSLAKSIKKRFVYKGYKWKEKN